MGKTKKFICPYCFEKHKVQDIVYRCIQSTCPGKTEDVEFARYRGLKEDTKFPPIIKWQPKNFWEAWTAKTSLAKRNVRCTSCGNRTHIIVCPTCHNELPSTTGKSEDKIIAIIGAKNAGKSNLIGVLINELQSTLGSRFQWGMIGLGDTLSRYSKVFYTPLYIENPNRPVDMTTTAQRMSTVKDPYIFQLTHQNGKSVTFVFFDTAGEEFNDEKNMALVTRYLCHSSGIILLLDPLQLSGVRQSLKSKKDLKSNQIILPPVDVEVGNILPRTINLIRSFKDIQDKNKIPIPLAVTFSKIDLLLEDTFNDDFFPQDAQIRYSGKQDSWLEADEVDAVSEEMEYMLYAQGSLGESIVNTAKAHFQDYHFFGVSAFGRQPYGTPPVIGGAIMPIRIEDPLLWLLWKNNFLEAKRG